MNRIDEIDRNIYNNRFAKLKGKNAEHVKKFMNSKTNITLSTKSMYLRSLHDFLENIDIPIKEITDDDINRYYNWVQETKSKRTYNMYTLTVKPFFKYIYDKDGWCYWCSKDVDKHTKMCKQLDYPKSVNHLKKQNNLQITTQSPDLLLPEDIDKILNGCKDLKTRTFFHMLWEMGCRPRALCLLNYEDVKPKNGGFSVTIRHSKTFARTNWIIEGRNDLDAWLRQHPYKEGPLFCNPIRDKKNWHYRPSHFNYLLQEAKKRAGIKRRCYLYLFRKSRATELARRGWNQSLIEKQQGWSTGSKILINYIRLADTDLEKQQQRDVGILIEEDEKPIMMTCPWCKTRNKVSDERCWECKRDMDTSKMLRDIDDRQAIAKEILKELLPAIKPLIHKEVLLAKKTPTGPTKVFAVKDGKFNL